MRECLSLRAAGLLDRADSVRASLPNKYCDPKISADLFEECLDEHLLCDDLGINVVSIEHHSGINSLYGASPMILGILARQTKKVRILSLGTLITVRPDPVRIAEEYATADVISRGRLEIGFVKSGDSEMVSGNANPVGYVERFWEAIDLIQKTLTSHDGPVQLGGQALHAPPRQHLAAGLSAAASADVGGDRRSRDLGRIGPARHGQCARVARPEGIEARLRRLPRGAPRGRFAGPGTDRFAYAALCYVGDTDEEGVRVGSKTLWFLNTSLKQSPQMSKFLPGRCRRRSPRRTTARNRSPAPRAAPPTA